VQNGVGAWDFSSARSNELCLQLGQFGFKLAIDHDQGANDATGIAMAGRDQIVDFGIELGHKNLLPRFRMASIIGEVLHEY
jgi:hypothetical protein